MLQTSGASRIHIKLYDLSGNSETAFSFVCRPAQVDTSRRKRSASIKHSHDGLVSAFPFSEYVGTDSTGDNHGRSLLQWC